LAASSISSQREKDMGSKTEPQRRDLALPARLARDAGSDLAAAIFARAFERRGEVSEQMEVQRGEPGAQ
jgi:hypothetical protein